jgi:hypothetical protein
MSSVWGPPIWTLLHALAAKVKEDKFAQLKPQLVSFIKMICFNLPCPNCSSHAKSVLSKVRFERILNPTMLQNVLCAFHNTVNKRKNKPEFEKDKLSVYAEVNLVSAFNNFVAVFHTKGNMKMISESFQRAQIVKQFRKWFTNNLPHFTHTTSAPLTTAPLITAPLTTAPLTTAPLISEDSTIVDNTV